jgi:hypothetical protein
MSEPSLPLQDAIVAALKNAAGVAALVSARIYDQVPPNPTFPYLSLGDVQVLPDKADCIDGVEIFPQIDAWSRTVGYTEVKSIGAAIIAALDDVSLIVSGHTVVVFEIESVHYLRDPDGLTRHAALTFRGLLQPA